MNMERKRGKVFSEAIITELRSEVGGDIYKKAWWKAISKRKWQCKGTECIGAWCTGPSDRGNDNVVRVNWKKDWEVGGKTVDTERGQSIKALEGYNKAIGYVPVTVGGHGQGWIKPGSDTDWFTFFKSWFCLLAKGWSIEEQQWKQEAFSSPDVWWWWLRAG